mmetsp:Transcript_105901/g.299360  ORF Transcript_105901/g.299360 Transcript_105901/m.299360 type:complete len:480 (+) Transcript_105901:96-1535(+)
MPASVRKSIRRREETALFSFARHSSSDSVEPDEGYTKIVEEARRCVGHGATEGAFPEEWDAQLLVDCGYTCSGHRIMLFCPHFLTPVLNDPDELDRAVRYILLMMDSIAMREKYVFIYCYLGMDWSDPRLAQRLRLAFDILPQKYAKNLQSIYFLHVTAGFRITMWTFRPWLRRELWRKIEYVKTLDALCETLHPVDEARRADMRRRFPQIVQRQDAEWAGREAPVTFGVPLRQLCRGFGVDFTDKTTGRWYPRLPPALIFLCEAMEREAADEEFGGIFSADATAVYNVVEMVDQGRPLDRDMPMSALWCTLKLFLDCLPCPLLSFQAFDELRKKNIHPDDIGVQRDFLVDMFQNKLSEETAYVALYVASFLHTMCENAHEKRASAESSAEKEEKEKPILTHALAAKVFTPSFIRPKVISEENSRCTLTAVALVETFIGCIEEPDLWIGRPVERDDSSTSSDSSDEKAESEGNADDLDT